MAQTALLFQTQLVVVVLTSRFPVEQFRFGIINTHWGTTFPDKNVGQTVLGLPRRLAGNVPVSFLMYVNDDKPIHAERS